MPSHDLDLAAYARRVGLAGRRLAPDLPTLAALVEAHGRAIAFENIEVLAGRVPALDLPALHDKIVVRGRGGYCFEQNGLLLGVLREIGFEVTGREGRVLAGAQPGTPTSGRTHMVVQVSIEGVDWLADVGFGGLAPTAPLRLASRDEQPAGTSVHRLVDDPLGLRLQLKTQDGWADAYIVAPSLPQPIDYQIANWFVATWPKAFLGNNLLVARYVDGGRMRLFNRQLEIARPSAARPEIRLLDTRAELRDLLADGFGLALADADIDAAMAVAERAPT